MVKDTANWMAFNMAFNIDCPSTTLNCLACCWIGQQVNIRQIEMGWPDIHWLARDQGGLVAAMIDSSQLGLCCLDEPHEPRVGSGFVRFFL
jgi:hypothetical protein